jgi:hypothetical protein
LAHDDESAPPALENINVSSDPIGGILGSAAGVPIAQSARAHGAAAQQQVRVLQQQRAARLQADRAAGIAEPDAKEMELQERDADGRQAWRRVASKTTPPNETKPALTAPPESGIDLIG